MVALKGMLVKWSNHCYDHPIDEDRDYEPAHDAHGALSKWKKLWPSKQARLSCQKRSNSNAVRSDIDDICSLACIKQDQASCLSTNSLRGLNDQQQQQQQQQNSPTSHDGEPGRRWWAISARNHPYSASASSAAEADLIGGYHNSSPAGPQDDSSSCCSSLPNSCRFNTSKAKGAVLPPPQQQQQQQQQPVLEEEDTAEEEEFCSVYDTFSLDCWELSSSGKANTVQSWSSKQQLPGRRLSTASSTGFSVHSKASSHSYRGSISRRVLQKGRRSTLLLRSPYNEKDLLKLKQLGRVEEETLVGCVDRLPQLVQDTSCARVLGCGSYGTVYQLVAPWPNAAVAAEVEAAFPDGRFASGMPVVVKMVEYNPDDPEWSTEMCQREERTCVKVNGSPWAPQLLWAAHAEACSWFIFEALTPDPFNLDDYLAARPDLPTETIFHIMDQLGRALDDLHSKRGLVHNDLKPAQVCLPRRVLSAPRVGPAPLPSIYLVDYGISCRRGKAVIDHGFGGTLIYMDPHLKSEALVRVGFDEDECSGEVVLQYKVAANPQGCYQPAYDFFSLGQILAYILARGNEQLHQKVVCMTAAAFAAGNKPEHYQGIRALLCNHPSATKGLLDVLCALLGPQEQRPCSYRQLQQLLATARMDCKPESDSKRAWQSVSALLNSGKFCRFDDELLIGQLEDEEDKKDEKDQQGANISSLAVSVGQDLEQEEQQQQQQLKHQAVVQSKQQSMPKQEAKQQLPSLGMRVWHAILGPFRSLAQGLRVARLPAQGLAVRAPRVPGKEGIRRQLQKWNATLLPCLHPAADCKQPQGAGAISSSSAPHSSSPITVSRPIGSSPASCVPTSNSPASHMPASSSPASRTPANSPATCTPASSSPANRTPVGRSRASNRPAGSAPASSLISSCPASTSCDSTSASSSPASRDGAISICSTGSGVPLSSNLSGELEQRLQRLVKEMSELGLTDCRDLPLDARTASPLRSCTPNPDDSDLMMSMAMAGEQQLLVLRDSEGSECEVGEEAGVSGDAALSLFELMLLLPGQEVDEVAEVQEMLGWLLFKPDE